MGTILASAITSKALTILHDSGGVKWTAATELFGYVNMGQRAVCRLVPSAYVLSEAVICVSGCKQVLPAGTTLLLSVTRNMGTAETAPGRVPTRVNKKDMDMSDPSWMTVSASNPAAAEVIHWLYDLASPMIFYVWPPQPSSAFGYLELERCAAPADIASHATVITIGDEWEQALLDAVLHYAYLKDSGHSQFAIQRADQHLKSFMSSTGVADKAKAQEALMQAAG